jgi:hypothetical protein
MYNAPPVPFQIRFTKEVVFKDQRGTVVKVYGVGEIIDSTHDTGIYFVTPMGGIYHDEAERVQDDA